MDYKELLRQHPFLRLLLPLIIGILLAESFDVPQALIQMLLVVSFLLMLLFVSISKLRKSYELRSVFGLIISVLLICAGAYRLNTIQEEMRLRNQDSGQIYKLELLEDPVEKSNTFSCLAKIRASVSEKEHKDQTAKAILYFQKDSLVKQLRAGDYLLLKSKLAKVKNAGNPYEFDFAGYLKTKHVLYSSYVKKSDWIKLSEESKRNLRVMALHWRDDLLQIYRDNGIREESFDILAALTLGYKASLDPEVRSAWADAGAMHVLAVSGLHVGIIYLIMNFILGFLSRVRYGILIRSLLLLSALWFYALLTGLSPSVMRAACMFSFIIIGVAIRRKGGVFNSLAASAFCLLLYDPYLLFTLGFQFSYVAVAGIVFFQARFDKLLYIKNPILDKFWQLTTVALSAQIATFPLTIYYFNQFPTYFLLSGYVVITLAGILIYLSALLLILSQIELLSNLLGWILQKLVEVLNQIIIGIQKIPGAVIQNCSFSTYEVLILYSIIIALIFVTLVKRKSAVFVFLFLMIAFQLPRVYSLIKTPSQEIVVFNAGQNSLIAFRSGNSVLYLQDDGMNENKRNYLTGNYQLRNRIQKIQSDTIPEIDFRLFAGKSILILDGKENHSEELLEELEPDILLVRKSGLKINNILTKCHTNSIVVIDGSTYRKDLQRLHEARLNKIANFFVVKDTGAFVLDLSSQRYR
ncbi:ComEC/Rec2 family competence protein [Marinifilum sp.]|uniref:ComEC/Rec2 family competence protein n=1 Tax=Marinifilum sp. TaxID=2033137 RepID=UPI003BA9980E